MIISTYLYYGVPARVTSENLAEAEGRAQANARVTCDLDNARGARFEVQPYRGMGRRYKDRNHQAARQTRKIA